MKNNQINIGVIKKIAAALGELNGRVVYVGGAVVSLYINDPAADEVRPTKDIDISLEILSLHELEEIRIQLQKKKFIQTNDLDVMCRFRYDDVTVDVMSTKAIGWAPSDRWFAPGFKVSELVRIEEQEIRILPFPYFLATKFSAFHDRGAKDPRASKDFEDIVFLLDNKTDLVESVLSAPEDVKLFLRSEFNEIFRSDTLQEAVLSNLFYETRDVRYEMLAAKLQEILISD